MKLNDLTKEELLRLIFKHGIFGDINDHEIKSVRWETLMTKAKKMADQAIKDMEVEHGHGPQNYTAYKKAHDDFDKAMGMYAEADKVWEARP
ncbi:MAG: hypothetical protein KKE05_03535 [Nanoarchaeota archaeon]|nr:hypothetical protein [Nanoarchaeota archaeon]